MRVKEFIADHCSCCDDYDPDLGCRAYLNEECDEAHAEPKFKGKTMRLRIDEYCAKRGIKHLTKMYDDWKEETKKKAPKKKTKLMTPGEPLDDIILQIWNDGAEYIIYDDSDLKHFRKRIKEAVLNEEAKKGKK